LTFKVDRFHDSQNFFNNDLLWIVIFLEFGVEAGAEEIFFITGSYLGG
jgi:hypothetical protein